MKLAITDACIFIDLYDLQLTAQFFSLPFQFHTSVDVINELYEQQQQLLAAFQSVGKLTVHIIKEKDKKIIQGMAFPKSLSESDKIVLYLASKLKTMVISSDKTVRNVAKNNVIEYHGMIWIFDRLIENNSISKMEAAAKLKQLITTNLVFQNNKELVSEMEKRLALWAE
jgi:predicted nucleic acid-binding protein